MYKLWLDKNGDYHVLKKVMGPDSKFVWEIVSVPYRSKEEAQAIMEEMQNAES